MRETIRSAVANVIRRNRPRPGEGQHLSTDPPLLAQPGSVEPPRALHPFDVRRLGHVDVIGLSLEPDLPDMESDPEQQAEDEPHHLGADEGADRTNGHEIDGPGGYFGGVGAGIGVVVGKACMTRAVA